MAKKFAGNLTKEQQAALAAVQNNELQAALKIEQALIEAGFNPLTMTEEQLYDWIKLHDASLVRGDSKKAIQDYISKNSPKISNLQYLGQETAETVGNISSLKLAGSQKLTDVLSGKLKTTTATRKLIDILGNKRTEVPVQRYVRELLADRRQWLLPKSMLDIGLPGNRWVKLPPISKEEVYTGAGAGAGVRFIREMWAKLDVLFPQSVAINTPSFLKLKKEFQSLILTRKIRTEAELIQLTKIMSREVSIRLVTKGITAPSNIYSFGKGVPFPRTTETTFPVLPKPTYPFTPRPVLPKPTYPFTPRLPTVSNVSKAFTMPSLAARNIRIARGARFAYAVSRATRVASVVGRAMLSRTSLAIGIASTVVELAMAYEVVDKSAVNAARRNIDKFKEKKRLRNQALKSYQDMVRQAMQDPDMNSMGTPEITIDTSEFGRALQNYMQYTKKSLLDVVNQKSYWIAMNSYRMTKWANPQAIRAELNRPSRVFPTLTVAEAVVVTRLQQKGHRIPMSKIKSVVSTFINKRVRSSGFLRRGWINSIKIMAPYADKKDTSINFTNRSIGGGANPARPNEQMRYISSIWTDIKVNDKTRQIIESGVQQAFNKEAASMNEYVLNKLGMGAAKFNGGEFNK